MERHRTGVRLEIGNTVTGYRSNIIENMGSPLERCLSIRQLKAAQGGTGWKNKVGHGEEKGQRVKLEHE